MKTSVFAHKDYRSFLKETIAAKDGTSRGFKSRLAEELGCQRTFISQVLSGNADFNSDHADAFCRMIGLEDEESDFFLTLVSIARAGSEKLKSRLHRKLEALKEQQSVLKNRFKEKKTLSVDDQHEYYSTWLYGAIRVLLSIPKYQSRSAVESYFRLPPERIHSALQFLLSRQLIVEKGKRLETGVQHMYLGNDSKLVIKHHTNWRLKAIDSMEFERPTDLHFSSVYSLSREDAAFVRERLMDALKEVRDKIKPSPEECMYTLCLDYFEV
jgi:uncharacterized protein (TIGR02147 family)